MPIRIKGPTADRHPRRPWDSPERRKERQQQYMDKHGDPGPRRKRLTPRDATARDRAKKIGELHERMGGGEKAKPHSSKEGRTASGRRRLERFRKKAEDMLKPLPKWKLQPYKVPAKRAKHAVGGVVKAGKRFLDFIKTGKHVDKHGVKTNVPKAAERLTGKPHVDHGKRKRIKHLGKGKAEGGRANFRHGGSVGAAIRGYGAVIK